MQHKIHKLKSGLELILAHSKAQPTVSVQIWFRAGSALEGAENQGIAHFLEHMFFKGTAKRPEGKMTFEVESFGGEINAFTSFDYTCYYINAPKANLMECIDILLDMVSAPLFKEIDLPAEREVVFEEYRRSLDAPKQFGFMKVQEACFPKGYAHPIIGNEGTIKKFTLDQLKTFRENFYNNQNAFLLVAGDVETLEDQIIQLATKFTLPDGHQSEFIHFGLKGTDSINSHQKDVRMANLTWSISSLGHQDPGSEYEDLGLSILGHGDSSRLYTSLVSETGIANNCSTSTMFFKKGGV
ncbi:MAG: pitrilysin family protein, partial [Bdellovibrionota bacterium]